jgi:diguanylate cyclase (GGDEF)-like protein
MTKILVVDDHAINRKLLVTLLESEGYLTAAAADGSDGLAAARRERPQLVISDILMPTMDGYEFVRRLRQEPDFSDTPVIFYTAHYHEFEARTLADKCGVSVVLVKPSSQRELLAAVDHALRRTPAVAEAADVDNHFDVEHLRLLTDKLSQKSSELLAANARLSALTDLNVQLASERDPQALLQQVCTGARNLLGARYAVLAVEERDTTEHLIACHAGLDLAGGRTVEVSLHDGLLGRAYADRRALRTHSSNGEPINAGLPAQFPAPQAVLAAPVSSLSKTYGWLCLVDKIGAVGFSAHDEQLLTILGAQVGRVYENGSLYRTLQKHADQLQTEMQERERANERLRASEERVVKLNHVFAMLSGVNSLIVRVADRMQLLQDTCSIAVEQGGFKAAWCGFRRLPEREITQAFEAGDLAQENTSNETFNLDRHPLVVAAMQSRQTTVCNNLDGPQITDSLSHALLARGCRSLAATPLIMGGVAAGCLVLISSDVGVFDDAEILLLNELRDDVSFALDHIEQAERLNYLAYYDDLTGLANRTFLQERLAQHIRSMTEEQLFALIVADIENFDSLNDTLGRAGGDELLRGFARRLVTCAGDAGFAARSGADEFAAVIPRPMDAMEVTRTVERWVSEICSTPFEIAGQTLSISVKIGIALYPQDDAEAASLLRKAETALKTAKQTHSMYAFYTSRLGKALHERRTLESSLRHALDKGELLLYYQPKVDFETRRVMGVEALMRWRHPQHGIVLPNTFISIMEETGMIVEAGVWALRQAGEDHARWLKQSLPAPRVAVNVSSVQLRREDFVRTVAAAVELAGPEGGIDVEVTESLLMKDLADNIEKLSRIRDLGVGIALDDFGTGFSSLAYLAKLPVQTIKIDRSFIEAMLNDPSTMTLVSTIISLAQSLKLKTVAEGVESEEQAKILRLLRCDQMQGYLVSKPMSFEAVSDYLGSLPNG